MDGDKQKLLIWTLAVLLVLAVGYIGYGVYQNVKSQQQMGLIQAGAQYGYEQAFLQIMQRAAACQGAVPVIYGNATLNLFAVECLQAQQQQAPQQAQ